MLLEVIVQSVADAVAATEGGADRLEVVRDIGQDGLTPPLALVREIAAATPLPLRVMVRERNTFTVSGPDELAELRRVFAALAGLGVDGAVLGFARDGVVDIDTTRAVMEGIPSLPVTFHRAFDSLADPLSAIDAIAALPQVDRILTSGGSGEWSERLERLRGYQARAAGRLTILAGGGVDAPGLERLAAAAAVPEAHIGRAACDPPRPGAPVSAARVARLRALAGPSPRR